MNTAQRNSQDNPKIGKRIMDRTIRSALARIITLGNPQHSTLTVAEAHAQRLLDSKNPYQSVYISDTEMLIGLKKTRDTHYPFRAIVYTDKGTWMLDVPLTATAQLSIIR